MCPDISPNCVNCKSAEAPLTDMFWSCSCLNKYWREILHTPSQVLDIRVEPNPLMALFGFMEGEEELTTEQQHASSFASLLAGRVALFRWREASPHTHTQWLENISCPA